MVDGWMDESERAEFEHWLEQVQGQARFAVVGPPDDAEPWIWGWCATVEQARRLYGEHVRVVDTVTGELVRFGSADLYGNRLRFAVQTLEVL